MVHNLYVISIVHLGLFSIASGLYFHLGETEKKCFIEDIPEDTMVVGKYKVELFDRLQNRYLPTISGFGMRVDVKDPTSNIFLSRVYAAEGRFTFTSHMAGEHVICLYSNSTAWFGGSQLRIHLDLRVGEHTNDYTEIAAKDKLTELQLRMRQLLDQVGQISKEQNYQRTREERFRQTSESTNQRVLWWAVAQTLIFLIIGFGQMRHLKSFFISKKLI
jgi:hypothetical protein